MKLPVLLLAASLAASLAGNAALVAAFFARPARAPAPFREFLISDADRAARAAEDSRAVIAQVAARTRIAAARAAAERTQVWAALATDDLKTLVARLRAAGFPPVIIRGVVNAQLERWFRGRLKEVAGDVTEAPFWKPDPGPFGNTTLYDVRNQLIRERTKLLRELLGDEFFSGASPNVTSMQRMEFGALSQGKIELIQRIKDDYAEMSAQVTAAAQGMILPQDREKIALLEREKRADLAALLTPAELEDYLMRTSPIINRLRQPLSFMDATEAEFRALYQIHQQFADLLYPPAGIGGDFGADLRQQRSEAQAKIAAQTRAALGEERYAEFVRTSSNEFMQLTMVAARENLPAGSAVRAYNAREEAAKESWRIMEDRALDNDQKRAALTALAQTATTQLIAALGPNAGNTYAKSASWLRTISSGGAITIGPDGSTRTRTLPPPGAPPPNSPPSVTPPPRQ
jgi:hypothetical protein